MNFFRRPKKSIKSGLTDIEPEARSDQVGNSPAKLALWGVWGVQPLKTTCSLSNTPLGQGPGELLFKRFAHSAGPGLQYWKTDARGIVNSFPGHPKWGPRASKLGQSGSRAGQIEVWIALAPPNLHLGQPGWRFVEPRDWLDSHLGAPGGGLGAILGPLGGNLERI